MVSRSWVGFSKMFPKERWKACNILFYCGRKLRPCEGHRSHIAEFSSLRCTCNILTFSVFHKYSNFNNQRRLMKLNFILQAQQCTDIHTSNSHTSKTINLASLNLERYTKSATMEEDHQIKSLYGGLTDQDRGSLARAITLVESTSKEKKRKAQILLNKIMEHNQNQAMHSVKEAMSFRIGLSGPPGAGKSTFIETFGKFLTNLGHRVAVLAVDPSSSQTGGSLLGDKTRMPELSCDPNAYIRPSPARGTLGGVTRTTNDVILLCEAAGYDIILVETIGVGQSEFVVADMVDMFCLLIPPAGGDELQGLKKGIVEVADMVIVNKCDGDLVPAARRIQTEYISALKFMRARRVHWKPQVTAISSMTKFGIPELWDYITSFQSVMTDSGELKLGREEQKKIWMWNYIRDHIMDLFKVHPHVKVNIKEVENLVTSGQLTPGSGADLLIADFMK